jgi:hypothetical protein
MRVYDAHTALLVYCRGMPIERSEPTYFFFGMIDIRV